jgi:hypothetical protein
MKSTTILALGCSDKSTSDMEQRYMAIGARRAEQNAPLSELVWFIVLTKRNLFQFINNSYPGRAADISGEPELLQLLDEFFGHVLDLQPNALLATCALCACFSFATIP